MRHPGKQPQGMRMGMRMGLDMDMDMDMDMRVGPAYRQRVVALSILAISIWASVVLADDTTEFATERHDIVEQLTSSRTPPQGRSEEQLQGRSKGLSGGLSEGRAKSMTVFPARQEAQVVSVTVLREHHDDAGQIGQVATARRLVTAPRVNLKVEFDVDSATLRPVSRFVLGELGAALQDPGLKGVRLAINGHTDNTGSEQHNLELSFRRAQSVRHFLFTEMGLTESQFLVQGFGEALPLNNNVTLMDRQLNRRVEIERLPEPLAERSGVSQ